MEMALGLFICFGIFAIGDFLGVLTKAKVSSVFVALLLFLAGFMSGILPADIIKQAGLTELGGWAAGFIVFHMGTLINFQQLIKEWRTVVLTILSMVVAGVALLLTGFIIDKNMMLASIPIINGGLIATAIVNKAAMDAALPVVAAFGTLLYAIQKFVGTPFASFFGLREAREILARHRAAKGNTAAVTEKKEATTATAAGGMTFCKKYDKYFTDFICIGVTAFFVFAAHFISKGLASIGVTLHFTILCLILGALLGYLNIVPPRILEKGRSSGVLTIALFASLIPSLAKIKIDDLVSLSGVMVIVFVTVVISLLLVFYVLPVWKLKGSRNLAAGISMGQLLGFPATYLIAQEVAKAVSDDKEEQEAVLAEVGSSYVIAGFASVTTFSIITAGLIAPYIGQ